MAKKLPPTLETIFLGDPLFVQAAELQAAYRAKYTPQQIQQYLSGLAIKPTMNAVTEKYWQNWEKRTNTDYLSIFKAGEPPSKKEPEAPAKETVYSPDDWSKAYQEGYKSSADIDYEHTKNLATLQGNINNNLEKLRGDYLLGSKDRDVALGRYQSDIGKETAFGVAEKEVKGKLDLQAIVNAGLKEVTGIQTEAQKAIATTQGEYSLKGEQERQRGQKAIADVTSGRQMYSNLIGAFNF